MTEDQIKAEQLRFKRHCAATLLEALAVSGLNLEEIDQRLGVKGNYLMRFINKLAKGETKVGEPMVMIAAAMNARVHLQLSKIEFNKFDNEKSLDPHQ